MNTQQISSIARQVLAIIAVVMGVLTASDSAIHLPVAVSSILITVGGIVVALEHFLSDPSTGTPTTTVKTSTTVPTAAVPPAPPAA